ncbi:hypothetical protein ACWNT8_01740 [Pigmentibacter ruber]|nr:hypothetical protein GTC16762_05460 [Pigmentibacter ruber]
MDFFKKLLILSIFLQCHYSFAETVNVYCSNISYNWKWLKNGNKKVTVDGSWKEMVFFPGVFIEFFDIRGGINKIEELTRECTRQYGEAYYIAQPANNFMSEWHTFGSNGYLLNGLFIIQSHNVSYGYSLYMFNTELLKNFYSKYLSYEEIAEKIQKLRIDQSYL